MMSWLQYAPPADHFRLTPREKQICRLVMNSRHNKDIAARLDISPKTVRVHLSNVYLRFSLNGKPDLILFLSSSPKHLS